MGGANSPLFCSSCVGSGGHRCSGPGSGGLLHLLRFQKMFWEKEKAEEREGEEGRRSAQEGEGRRRGVRRKGGLLFAPQPLTSSAVPR